MENPIYSAYLRNLMANKAIDSYHLDALLSCLEPGQQEIAIYILTGIIDIDAESRKLNVPVLGTKDCGSYLQDVPLHFISYNPLEDEVRFEYNARDTQYFKKEEDADAYSKDGSRSYYGVHDKHEDYVYEGTHVYRRESVMSKKQWESLPIPDDVISSQEQ